MSDVRAHTPLFGRFAKIVLWLLITSSVVGVGSASIAVWYLGQHLPDYHRITQYHPPASRPFVSIDAMPPALIHAFVSAEDRNFFTHPGIDISAIVRAMFVDVFRLASGQRPIGASTITQQVVRHFLLSDKLTLQRKIEEALLALRIERVLSKDRIFELYVNSIYFGCGNWGISDAARNYFGVPVENLTLPRAALLAGLPQAPSYYNPWRSLSAAKQRRDWVIDRMVEDGYITEQQALAARNTSIVTATRPPGKSC